MPFAPEPVLGLWNSPLEYPAGQAGQIKIKKQKSRQGEPVTTFATKDMPFYLIISISSIIALKNGEIEMKSLNETHFRLFPLSSIRLQSSESVKRHVLRGRPMSQIPPVNISCKDFVDLRIRTIQIERRLNQLSNQVPQFIQPDVDSIIRDLHIIKSILNSVQQLQL